MEASRIRRDWELLYERNIKKGITYVHIESIDIKESSDPVVSLATFRNVHFMTVVWRGEARYK